MSLWGAETKVVASTIASTAVGLVIAALNYGENHHALLGSLPTAVQAVILAVAPPLVTFLSGWAAKHTPRTAVPGESSGPVTGV